MNCLAGRFFLRLNYTAGKSQSTFK